MIMKMSFDSFDTITHKIISLFLIYPALDFVSNNNEKNGCKDLLCKNISHDFSFRIN